MSQSSRWVTVMAVCALVAGAVAADLVWMVLTRPIALADVLGRLW